MHETRSQSAGATWAKAIVVWLAILVAAVINGSVRESLLIPRLGEAAGLLVSGGLLSLFIVGIAWLLDPWYAPRTVAGRWRIGWLWLALTLAFEFGFGVFVQHRSLATMLAAYTFAHGNLWPVVLAITLVAPRLAGKLRGRG